MRNVKGIQIIGLNNIPSNVSTGYGNTDTGKVFNSDGSFLVYTRIRLIGSDDEALKDTRFETVSGVTADFQEVPCDKDGNVLMTHHVITRPAGEGEYSRENGYSHGVGIRLFIFCKQEPTHRINLTTGEISANTDDNYLRHITFSYAVLGL